MIKAVLTDNATGGTFLTWTLHFLAGHKNSYHARRTMYRSITTNIFNNGNAHGFKPTQPVNLSEYKQFSQALRTLDNDNFNSIYFHCLREDTWEQMVSQTREAIDDLKGYVDSIILLTSTDNRYFNFSIPRSTNKDTDTEYDHLPVWDKREWLSFKKMYHGSIKESFDFSIPHYPLGNLDLYNTFDITVSDLFSYIDSKIDATRYIEWLPVWHEWRHVHYSRMQYINNADTIIEYIKNGKNMDLTRFNLDIMQEANTMFTLGEQGYELAQYGIERFTSTGQLYDILNYNA